MALPGYIRRGHRIIALLWVLSFILTLVVPAVSELPGPSLPALLFIATIISGSYLLVRPWIRGSTTASDQLAGLRTGTRRAPVVIRRTHRIAATLLLLFLALVLAMQAAGGPASSLLLIPVVVFLLYLALSGLFMFLRPWVSRFQAR